MFSIRYHDFGRNYQMQKINLKANRKNLTKSLQRKM